MLFTPLLTNFTTLVYFHQLLDVLNQITPVSPGAYSERFYYTLIAPAHDSVLMDV
jgi:hypothetical protein